MKTKAKKNKSFVVIGTGNLAFHLCAALTERGFVLKQVVGRTRKKVAALGNQFGSQFSSNYKNIFEGADYYFVCVADDAIKKVVARLQLKQGLLIHCSGSVSMNKLKGSAKNYAVLYPLYTFSSQNKIDFKTVPFFVEGNNAVAEKEVVALAQKLSSSVTKMNSAKREKIHLAAVMSANFSNFLYTLAGEFLKREKAGHFNFLLPLIEKTTQKLRNSTSFEAQTGPARRHDKKVIERHLQLLEKYPEQKKLYNLLTSGIIKRYTKERK